MVYGLEWHESYILCAQSTVAKASAKHNIVYLMHIFFEIECHESYIFIQSEFFKF
jgi:hypothetical protein